MSSPRHLSSYDYRWALHDPQRFDVTVTAQDPLPELTEPAEQPPGPATVSTDLVEVHHRRIRNLSTYWHAGWPAATAPTLVRTEVARRLHLAADSLPARFGLAVLDAWRPLELQRAIYDAAYADPTLPAGFVSVPSTDPTAPPPHLTGGTVDVTLTWEGVALALGTAFDDFTDRARTAAFEEAPGVVRELRRLLFHTMAASGFVVIDCEWWHFEYGTRRWAAVNGQPPPVRSSSPGSVWLHR